ncbi:MAG TPA: thioredoxin domain-containing protein [Nitrososphaeraceae archaeon]|nr:thioredoxin domain-containing protein [Nitrososphaeraceae archaeon]
MILTVLLYISFITIVLFSFLTIESFAQWTIPSGDSLNNQKINFSTYESKDSNLKIDYPSDWILTENSSSNIEFHPQTTSQSEEIVKMSVMPLPSKSITMQAIVAETLKDKSENLDNFQLQDTNIVPNLQNIPMHKLVYSYINSNKVPVMQLDFGMINNNQLYLISFISSPSLYYNYLPTVDKMIGSLNKYFQEISLTKLASGIVKPVSENVKPLGNKDANITVIEFADYRCPFCHKFQQETFDKLVTNFINTGKAKYLFKDLVVNDRDEYKGSMQAAVASHCAAEQGKYWEYLKEIYKNFQPEPQHWVTLDSLVQFANNVQIQDIEKFKSCVESNKYQNQIQESGSLAKQLGITGTPTFVILKNDKIQTTFPGAVPYEYFEKTLNALALNS